MYVQRTELSAVALKESTKLNAYDSDGMCPISKEAFGRWPSIDRSINQSILWCEECVFVFVCAFSDIFWTPVSTFGTDFFLHNSKWVGALTFVFERNGDKHKLVLRDDDRLF